MAAKIFAACAIMAAAIAFCLGAKIVTTNPAVPAYDTVTVRHAWYASTFDRKLLYPVLVKWTDTKSRVTCANKLRRKNRFSKDPSLPDCTDLGADYAGSGLDRGHNCPADDNECDSAAQAECFYFSNMCPQYHALNAGAWQQLEEYTRKLAVQYDSIQVWCGSVGCVCKIGRVTVPEKCWKVLYVRQTKAYMAYVFDNAKTKTEWDVRDTVPLSIVEAMTGFKFNAKQ